MSYRIGNDTFLQLLRDNGVKVGFPDKQHVRFERSNLVYQVTTRGLSEAQTRRIIKHNMFGNDVSRWPKTLRPAMGKLSQAKTELTAQALKAPKIKVAKPPRSEIKLPSEPRSSFSAFYRQWNAA